MTYINPQSLRDINIDWTCLHDIMKARPSDPSHSFVPIAFTTWQSRHVWNHTCSIQCIAAVALCLLLFPTPSGKITWVTIAPKMSFNGAWTKSPKYMWANCLVQNGQSWISKQHWVFNPRRHMHSYGSKRSWLVPARVCKDLDQIKCLGGQAWLWGSHTRYIPRFWRSYYLKSKHRK